MDRIRYDLKTLNRKFHLASKQKIATSNDLSPYRSSLFLVSASALFNSLIHKDGTHFWHADCVRKHSQKNFT